MLQYQSTHNNTELFPTEANNARARGAEIYVVALGDNPNMEEVSGVANTPNSSYVIPMKTANDVTQAANALLDRLC
jgi:hypothetical protein